MENNCFNCGHEKTEWLPFTEINGKMYCHMCLALGIMGLKHYDELRAKGFQIITAGGVPAEAIQENRQMPEDEQAHPPAPTMTCKICGQPASNELPLYTLKGYGFCVVCLAMAAKALDGKMKKDIDTGKWWEAREN